MLKLGASACFFHSDPKRPIFKGKTLLYLEQSLAHWAQSQGALLYMIPTVGSSTQYGYRELVAELDGLLLQGGSDVSPKSYGEEPLKPEWTGDYVRDQYEIALVKEFLAQGKPILGVCRGAQLLNVAFGGTLVQDIATELPQAGNHRNWDTYDQNFHEIRFEPGSLLGKLYPGGRAHHRVNSIHHQALKKLGSGLKIEAVSKDDGVIEAVRLEEPGAPFVLAVQWHPEFHAEGDPSLLDNAPILKEFLRHAEKTKNA